MNCKEFYPKATAFVVALLLIGALASCTGAPAQVETAQIGALPTATWENGITPTYDNVVMRAEQAHGTAAALDATATALYVEQRATVAIIDAQIAANTQAALSLTQQVEQHNIASTQAAVSVAATATVSAIDLQNRQADTTATAQVMGAADIASTQQSADAGSAALELHRTEQSENLRTIGTLVGYVLTIGGIVGMALGLGYAAYIGLRFVSVASAIELRKRMVLGDVGLLMQPGSDEWQALPNGATPALPDPQGQQTRLTDVVAERKTQRQAANDEYRSDEQARNLRQAWRTNCIAFLKWGHTTSGDKPIGYSRRAICKRTKMSRDGYEATLKLLVQLGLLEKADSRHNAPYVLARGKGGEQLTLSQAIRAPVWATSYTCPTAALPYLQTPPAAPQHVPTHPNPAHPNPSQPINGGKNTSFVTPRASKTWNMASDENSLRFYLDNPDADVNDYPGGADE